MLKKLSVWPLFLVSSWVLAANLEEGAAAPVQTVSMVYIVIFLVFFIAMVGGFFVYLWWHSDKHSDGEK